MTALVVSRTKEVRQGKPAAIRKYQRDICNCICCSRIGLLSHIYL